MTDELKKYRIELQQELKAILDYWIKNTIDEINGGFVGKIDHSGKVYNDAPKGAVLNSRILWTFSAAYNLTREPVYLNIAARAFQYVQDYIVDKEYGGVYWAVDHKGRPLETEKEIYALSFAIYGLSEYFKASGNESSRKLAVMIYDDILKYSYDKKNGGYIEGFSRDWKQIPERRLGTEKKSMNTHLHLLEAFSNLLTTWNDSEVFEKVKELVAIFQDHIISSKTSHLVLFFDEGWNEKSRMISYGHDIEAAWLILEAAEKLKDDRLIEKVKTSSIKVTNAAAEGLDGDGGLWYEYDVDKKHLLKEKHWWPQSEAMVGFFNAWEITKDEKYLKQSIKTWEFVKEHLLDKKLGEWYWGVKEDLSPMPNADKVGIWKCPYHNSRACIEIINRINRKLDKN